MRIEMTTEQAIQIATNAVNAASPVGMGFLQHVEKDYTPEEVAGEFDEGGNAYFDYFRGRMTKLTMKQVAPDVYALPDHDPRRDYQSWCRTYPTYLDLVKSVIPEPVILASEAA